MADVQVGDHIVTAKGHWGKVIWKDEKKGQVVRYLVDGGPEGKYLDVAFKSICRHNRAAACLPTTIRARAAPAPIPVGRPEDRAIAPSPWRRGGAQLRLHPLLSYPWPAHSWAPQAYFRHLCSWRAETRGSAPSIQCQPEPPLRTAFKTRTISSGVKGFISDGRPAALMNASVSPPITSPVMKITRRLASGNRRTTSR